MAVILTMETASEHCSVALTIKGKVVTVAETESHFRHASVLTRLVEEVLSQAEHTMTELDAVAVSRGPGSYTALRVGASTAKGICLALDIPLLSVDTLQALAWGALHSLGENPPPYFLPMIQARKAEVYGAVYRSDLREVVPPVIQQVDEKFLVDIVSHYPGVVFCGNAISKHPEISSRIKVNQLHPTYHHASYLAELAWKKYREGDFENLAYFSPLYIRPPYITKAKKLL